jgi:hypothetical protein
MHDLSGLADVIDVHASEDCAGLLGLDVADHGGDIGQRRLGFLGAGARPENSGECRF